MKYYVENAYFCNTLTTNLLYNVLLSATGLSASQPNYPGPGDPDGTLSACDSPATGGGGIPVLPQCLGPSCLPLQGPPRSTRDSSC